MLSDLLSAWEARRDDAAAIAATAPVAAVYARVIGELRAVHGADLQAADKLHNEPPTDRFLRAKDVAARLNLSASAVYAAARRGGWPFVRRLPSGSVRFSERGLDRWLERQR